MANDTATVWGGTPKLGRNPTDGELLIGNNSANGFSLNNLTAGSHISISNAPGEITINALPYYGAFESHTQQTISGGAGSEMLVYYEVTNLSSGVSIGSNPSGQANTRIKVNNAGVYNLQFSIQVQPASANKSAFFWLKYNGNVVPYSNTEVDLTNNGRSYVAAWNFFYSMNANDYLELAWTSDDAGTFLRDGAAAYGPNIPSVIATMSLVG